MEGNTTGTVKYIIFTDPENKKLNMKAGDEKKLGIKISGDSSVQRKYTTSDKNVATIDKDGVVTAVGPGTCRITVVAGDQGGSIDVPLQEAARILLQVRPAVLLRAAAVPAVPPATLLPDHLVRSVKQSFRMETKPER